jgi:hypothetical protein
MSLQLLAKQMEAKGRKGDSMLVHMTPGEVAGLQKLAEAAGGSLSVNPETGLVEANFLKKLISSPMFAPLAGAGLMMIPGVGPMMAAGLVGGGTALATGDVGKGAMAGLGAYGGAGLAGGLSGLGSTALTPEAIATANASADPIASLVTAKDAATSAGVVPATGFKAIASGAQQAMANPSALVNQMGGVGGLAKAAGMAAAPMLTQEQKMAEAPVDDEMYSYEYNPGRTGAERSPMAGTSERKYFNSSYSPMRRIKPSQYGAAQGGLMSLAEGGSTGTSSEGMTGASKAAFDYLMGRSAASGFAGQGSGGRGGSGTFSGGDGMYSFDPATGQFTRNPNYRDPEDIERERLAAEAAAEEERRRAAAESRGGGNDTGRGEDAIDRAARQQLGENVGGDPFGAQDRAMRQQLGENSPGIDTFAAQDRAMEQQRGENVGGDPFGAQDRAMEQQRGENDYGGDVGYSDSATSQQAGEHNAAGGSISLADGGLMGLAKGGMKSGGFVIPADVVSMIGEGNTDAGYKRIKSIIPGATAIKGKDGGQSDTVKTSIEGKQRARVAHGEMYIPPETVKRLGGAKKLYAMMDRVRQQATGSKKQIKPVSLKRALA